MNNIKKKLKAFFCFLTCLILFNSCEDDTLLSPQVADEEEVGSYGLAVFPSEKVPKINLDNPEIF